MKRTFQYGRHLLRAKGRHGTHSPFVYAFVEQVMRARLRMRLPQQDYFRPRAAALLYKTLRYLHPQAIYAGVPLCDAVAAIAGAALPGVVVHPWTGGSVPERALVIGSIEEGKADRLQDLLEQPVMVLLAGPHKYKTTVRLWEQLAALPAVKMSLDYWHFGLLVNDDAFKAKQHFRLR